MREFLMEGALDPLLRAGIRRCNKRGAPFIHNEPKDKKMTKMKWTVLGLAMFFSLGGLEAAVLDKKGIKDVKKVALISLYSNKRVLLHQISDKGSLSEYVDPRDDRRSQDKHGSWAGKEQSDKEIRALYQFALTAFQDRLGEVPHWEFVPFSTVAASPAYRDFYKGRAEASKKELEKTPKFLAGMLEKMAVDASGPPKDQDHYLVADKMHFIPASLVTDGTKRFGNQDPFKGQKESLAKLCRDLNVDAVAMVNVRISHRYGKFARLKVGDAVKAIARAGSSLVLVSKDGKIVAQTGPIVSKLQEDFEGDSVSMIKEGKLLLEAPEVRKSFESTLSMSAEKMKEVLIAAFEKLK
jgi:hypothetical protein